MAIDTNLGDNRFTIRRGSAAPDSSKLLEYELGYAANDKNLYLGLGMEEPVLLGREVRAGSADPAATDFEFDKQTNVKKVYLWSGYIPETQPLASNKNLLLNWDFRHDIVNQRGGTSYSSNGYTVDRWYKSGDGTISVENGGIILENTTTGTEGLWLSQYLEQTSSTDKRIIYPSATVSVLVTDVRSVGEGFYIGIVFSDDTRIYSYQKEPNNNRYTTPGLYTLTTSATGKTISRIIISAQKGCTIKIACAKLEMGEMSTLMYDPPMDYMEELIKCYRFYQRNNKSCWFSAKLWSGKTYIDFLIPTIPMRKTPTPNLGKIIGRSFTGTSAAFSSNYPEAGTTIQGSLTLYPFSGGYFARNILTTADTLANYSELTLYTSQLILDAEIYP